MKSLALQMDNPGDEVEISKQGDGRLGVEFRVSGKTYRDFKVFLSRGECTRLLTGLAASVFQIDDGPEPSEEPEPEPEFRPCPFQGPGAYRLRNGQQVILDASLWCQESDEIADNKGFVASWCWDTSGEVYSTTGFTDCELAEFLSPLSELPEGYEFTEPKEYREVRQGEMFFSITGEVFVRTHDDSSGQARPRWIVKNKKPAKSLEERWAEIGEKLTAIVEELR